MKRAIAVSEVGAIRYTGATVRWLKQYPNYPAKVLEFRSGILVPGAMHSDGRFVPEDGGRRVKFSEYRYGPSALPVWNLPGLFVPASELRTRPEQKAKELFEKAESQRRAATAGDRGFQRPKDQ